jgi:hypothetical protein
MATLEISSAWAVITGTSAIMAIGVAFLRARKFVEERVQEALSRDDVLQKLSLLVKPDMVFNALGSVVVDRGAGPFVTDRGIHIKCGTPETGLSDGIPSEIRIAFTKHLKTAPLLTPLNPDAVFIRARRGESHDWIYVLNYTMVCDDDPEYIRQYRLEIL